MSAVRANLGRKERDQEEISDQHSESEFRTEYQYSKSAFSKEYQHSKSEFGKEYQCSKTAFRKKYQYSKSEFRKKCQISTVKVSSVGNTRTVRTSSVRNVSMIPKAKLQGNSFEEVTIPSTLPFHPRAIQAIPWCGSSWQRVSRATPTAGWHSSFRKQHLADFPLLDCQNVLLEQTIASFPQ